MSNCTNIFSLIGLAIIMVEIIFIKIFGSIMAMIVSINWNFTVVLVLAALSYLAAAFFSARAGKGKAA